MEIKNRALSHVQPQSIAALKSNHPTDKKTAEVVQVAPVFAKTLTESSFVHIEAQPGY